MQFNYEKLRISDLSLDLIEKIYKMTNELPKEELYGLTSQLRRAAMSVLLNIAEGASQTTAKNQARFYTIAIGSLMETDACLKIAERLKYLKKEKVVELKIETTNLLFALTALRNSAKSKQ